MTANQKPWERILGSVTDPDLPSEIPGTVVTTAVDENICSLAQSCKRQVFEFTSSYAKKEDLYTDRFIYKRVLRKLAVTRSGESAGLVLIFTSQAVFHTLEMN